MTPESESRSRRSVRLRGYDYAQPGAYFVTTCTHGKACVLGRVRDGRMVLNGTGVLVRDAWSGLATKFQAVATDAFVVMPNHVHGIVLIGEPYIHLASEFDAAARSESNLVGARFIAPTNTNAPDIRSADVGARFIAPGVHPDTNTGAINRAPTRGTPRKHIPLGEIVRIFKASATRAIRSHADPAFRWQRSYYEHIIRTEDELNRIREYIVQNPANWERDPENPAESP